MRALTLALALACSLFAGTPGYTRIYVGSTPVQTVAVGPTTIPGGYEGSIPVIPEEPEFLLPDIGGNLLWLSAFGDGAGLTKSGAAVTKWENKANPTDFAEPLYAQYAPTAVTVDGRTWVWFGDGTTRPMPEGGTGLTAPIQTLFVVCDPAVTPTPRPSMAVGEYVGDYSLRFLDVVDNNPRSFYLAANSGDFGNNASYGGRVAVNGTVYGDGATVQAPVPVIVEVYLGSRPINAYQLSSDFQSRYYIGGIGEVIGYADQLTGTEASLVGRYLAAKWGIPTTYPDMEMPVWFKLDDADPASTTLADSGTAPIAGVLAQAASSSATSVPGVDGTAQFFGGNTWAEITGAALSVFATDHWTMSFWCKREKPIHPMWFSSNQGMFYCYYDVNIGVLKIAVVAKEIPVTYTMNAGVWYHCVIVKDNATGYSVYINGASAGTDTASAQTPTITWMHIGGGTADWDFPSDRYLDDFRLYDRSLSAQEAADLYASYRYVPSGPSQITVYFDAGWGWADYTEAQYTPGASFSSLPYAYNYSSDYSFTFWRDGNWNIYSAESAVPGESLTLYAEYTYNPPITYYTMYLDAAGGTVDPSQVSGIPGGTAYENAGLPIPYMSDYTFVGWYSSYWGTTVGIGNYYTINTDETLYAQWTYGGGGP